MNRVVFDLSLDGHRASYFQVFESLLKAHPLMGRNRLKETYKSPFCIYMSVDDYFLSFFFLALLRSLRGYITFGLLLRSENIVRQGLTPKRILKRILLRMLKHIPGTTTVGIVPFHILPELRTYLDSTIFDLQFWDLPLLFPKPLPSPKAQKHFAEIKKLSKGRWVIAALGRQDETKGTSYFFDLWNISAIREKFFFVVVGSNRSIAEAKYQHFQSLGGYVWDENVSEEDLVSTYKIADAIWCCYDPSYDVSSGIYGRSVQLEKLSLLRESSLISKYADTFRTSLNLPFKKTEAASQILLTSFPEAINKSQPSADFKLMRSLFEQTFENN